MDWSRRPHRRSGIPPGAHGPEAGSGRGRRHGRLTTAPSPPVVVITGGIGKFSHARCRGEGSLDRGLSTSSPASSYTGKDVVIVGGGDSAFDWAVHLEPIASSVTLVHRRDKFRAHAATVTKVRRPTVGSSPMPRSRDPWQRLVAEVDIAVDGETTTRPAQAIVRRSGFIADLGPIQSGGSRSKRHIVVDPSMRTTLPRVFAAGDITEYPGKVRLIAVGFGEAATAVNNAAVVIDPSAHIFPGHSSEGADPPRCRSPPSARTARRTCRRCST